MCELNKDMVDRLLRVYDILVSHYQHEDKLLEDRNKFFVTLVIALFIATTGFLTSPYFKDKSLVYALCGFGIIVSFLWWGLVSNSLYYIKLRMQQAIEIERKLGFSVFETEWKLCYRRIPVEVGKEELKPPPKYWLHGANAPKVLSCIFLILWTILLFYSIISSLLF